MKCTKFAAGVLASALILSMSSSIAFAADTESKAIDSITFSQEFIVSNNTDTAIVPEIGPFTYSIGNDVDTSFATVTGDVTVQKGNLEKVSLENSEIVFDKEIPANTVNEKFTYGVTIKFGTFDNTGVYRYSLDRNDGKSAIFDVFVFNEDGKPVVCNCTFYDGASFTADKQVKITGFIDTNDNSTLKSIIRFEDEKGNLLVDDIILSKATNSSSTDPKTPITIGGHGYSKLTPFVFEVFTELNLGLDQYNQNLQTLQSKYYSIVKDEVAENLALDEPVWFDPNEVLVFHVVMHAPVIFKVQLYKVDYNNNTHYLKDAEFTIFREDGTIVNDVNGNPCIGVTDENGFLEFKILYEEGTSFYVQETKPPRGYNINKDKFPITPTNENVTDEGENVLKVPIRIADIVIIPPRTGDSFNPVYYIVLTVLGISGVAISIIYLKRKKINTKKS